jgi:uncharacterized protein (DUF1501 family)
MGLHRRDFCKLAGFSGAVAALAPRLSIAATPGSRDVLVCVFQRGAMDGLNSVVPYADANYKRLRPTIALPEPGAGQGATLNLDGFYALNPAAAPLKPMFDAGELAIVHATGSLHGDLSHFSAQSLMERGVLAHQSVFNGWLNRHLSIIGPTVTFQAVGMGTSVPLALHGPAPTFGMSAIANVTLDTRSRRASLAPDLLQFLHAGTDGLDKAATQAFDAMAELASADPGQYAVENGASYPAGAFGNQLREVAQLIKAGIGLEVACVDIGGWDHHNQLNAELTPLLGEFSQALAAFRADLGARMAQVNVVCMTEFGRRAYENGSAGTDHGIGGVMFAFGGGVRGGKVYGQWPGLSDANLLDGNLAITTDYRSVLSELLQKRMGNAASGEVFPGFVDGGALGMFNAR